MCLISKCKLSNQLDTLSEKEIEHFNRPEGCTHSCSNLSTPQTVPSALFSRNALPIQSNAIWANNSSQSLHKANGYNRAVSEVSTGSHLHVPGRLVNQESTSLHQRKIILKLLHSLGLVQ